MSYADKLKYVKQMDQLKTVIKDTREKVKTTSLHLTSGLDKSLKYVPEGSMLDRCHRSRFYERRELRSPTQVFDCDAD